MPHRDEMNPVIDASVCASSEYDRLSLGERPATILLGELRLNVYPHDHPHYGVVHAICDELGIPRERCVIYADATPNAFANERDQIFISSSLLSTIQTREELAAVLAHEQSHISTGDIPRLNKVSRSEGWRARLELRAMEARADLGEMSTLSDAGINPLGAILLTERFRSEETRAVSRGDLPETTQFFDPTHGTMRIRIGVQRESIRVRDYPGLSQKFTALELPDASDYLPTSDRDILIDALRRALYGHPDPDLSEEGCREAVRALVQTLAGQEQIPVDAVTDILILNSRNMERFPSARRPFSRDSILQMEEIIRDRSLEKLGLSLDLGSASNLWNAVIRSASYHGLEDFIVSLTPYFESIVCSSSRDHHNFGSNTILRYIEGKVFKGEQSPCLMFLDDRRRTQEWKIFEKIIGKLQGCNLVQRARAASDIDGICDALGIKVFNVPTLVSDLSTILGLDELRQGQTALEFDKRKQEQCRGLANRVSAIISTFHQRCMERLNSIGKGSHRPPTEAILTLGNNAMVNPGYHIEDPGELFMDVEVPRRVHFRVVSTIMGIIKTVNERCAKSGFERALGQEHTAVSGISRDECSILFARLFRAKKSYSASTGVKQLRNEIYALACDCSTKEGFLSGCDRIVNSYLRSSGSESLPGKMLMIRKLVEQGADYRARIFEEPRFEISRSDLSQMGMTNNRLLDLVRVEAGGSSEKLGKMLVQLNSVWPLGPRVLSGHGFSMERELAHDKGTWLPFEQDFETRLHSVLSRKVTRREYEELLLVFTTRPSDITGIKVAGVIFERIVQSTSSFSEVIRLLDKYDHLPLTILGKGFQSYLATHALSWSETSELRVRLEARASLQDAGKALLTHHIGEVASAFGSPRWSRGMLAIGLLTSGYSDRLLKTTLSQHWWKGAKTPAQTPYQLVQTVTRQGCKAESKDRLGTTGKPDEYRVPINSLRQGQINWSEQKIPSFQVTLNELVIAGPYFQYLLIRELLLGGVAGNHGGKHPILEDRTFRTQMFMDLITTYVAGGDRLLSTPAISALLHGIATGPDSEDLFFYIGHALAGLAAQEPKDPTPRDFVPPEFLAAVRETARECSQGYFADTRGFRNTTTLIDAAAHHILLGLPVTKFSYSSSTRTLSFKIPPLTEETFSLKELLHDRFLGGERGRLIVEGSSMVDLMIMAVEHTGALGRRYLQFDAMLRSDSYTEADREKIELSYDRSPLLDVVRVQEAILREAKRDATLAAFVETISHIHPIEHGGSIFTVARVTDTAGDDWAVHIVNPNAEFLAQDLSRVAVSIIDAMPSGFDPQKKSMAKAVLAGATTWTTDEVRDPLFRPNIADFTERYSVEFESRCPEAFKQSLMASEWRMFVPEFKDSVSTRVRVQRWVEGETLVRVKRGDVTDPARNLITEEDAKEIARLLAGSFVHQLFETGVMHSNFHPGQFMYTEDKRLAILDTKNIIRFAPEERERILQSVIQYTTGDKDRSLRTLVEVVVGPSDQNDSLIEAVQKRIDRVSSGDLSGFVTAVLGTLYEHDIEIENRWMLLGQNLLGLRRTLAKLGFEMNGLNLLGEELTLESTQQVYPNTTKLIFG